MWDAAGLGLQGGYPMRKLILRLAFAATIAPDASHAQMTLDMSRVTCADVAGAAAGPRGHVRRIHERLVQPALRLRHGRHRPTTNETSRACGSGAPSIRSRTIMAALEQSHPQPGPPGAPGQDRHVADHLQAISRRMPAAADDRLLDERLLPRFERTSRCSTSSASPTTGARSAATARRTAARR